MELRRPTIADKETILEMLAEFEKAGSVYAYGSMISCSIKAVISDIPFARRSVERAMPRPSCDLVCRKPQAKIFPRSL